MTTPTPRFTVSLEERNAQIEKHLPIVDQVLSRVSRNFPRCMDLDNLRSAGVAGLVDAASKYDPKLADTFRAYARIRIHGAMLDAVREADATPRAARRWAKRLTIARAQVESQVGREATRDEVGRELGITAEELTKWEDRAQTVQVMSFDAPYHRDTDGVAISLHTLVVDRTEGVAAKMEHEEKKELMVRLISELPAQQKRVLALHYHEGCTLKEVGEAMGLTESRVCQIKKDALASLRVSMKQERYA